MKLKGKEVGYGEDSIVLPLEGSCLFIQEMEAEMMIKELT